MAKERRNLSLGEEDQIHVKRLRSTCVFRNMLLQCMKSCEETNKIDLSFCLPNFRTKKENEINGQRRTILSSVVSRISCIFQVPMVSCCSVTVTKLKNDSASRQLPFRMLEDEVEEFIASETGRDRIIRAMNSCENEKAPPDEAVLVLRVAQNVFLVGFIYGFFKGGALESTAFLQRNKTTVYGSPSLANKRLANTVIGKGMGTGIKLGLKSFLATSTLLGIWRGLCVYYNTSSPWTFAVATGTVLSISKVSLGPKGLAGGAIIGSVLGGLVGGLLQLILVYSGNTQQQINYKQVQQKLIDKRAMQQNIRALTDEEDEMID